MTFRPSSPLASSRTSPLAPKSSAKPSFYKRVWLGKALEGLEEGKHKRGCEEANASYPPMARPWFGDCHGIVGV